MAGSNINDSALVEYRRAVKVCIRGGKEKTALTLLQHALSDYPDDPFILSFYGCLEAKIGKRYQSGVENCKKAIILHQEKPSSGKQVSYPVLYLNLGRAYMAAGRRKEGLISFYAGLKYGRNNEIIKELETAGMRKAPPLPFLERSNLINKYVGLMIHRVKTLPQKSSSLPAFMMQKRNS
jgi:tetratricopeptide (TPR) repeat protein